MQIPFKGNLNFFKKTMTETNIFLSLLGILLPHNTYAFEYDEQGYPIESDEESEDEESEFYDDEEGVEIDDDISLEEEL